ncbi:MAG: glycosyltransferase family 39 protein, partial [archaeon]|nr:glycosyltransferase family 39 protein [archaeon]
MKNEEQMLGDVMSEFVQKNKFSIAFSRFFFNLKTFRLDLGIVLLALFSFLLASLLLNFLHFFDFAPVTVFSAVIFLVLKFFLPQKILLSEMSKNDFIVIGFFVLVYVFFHFSLNGLLFDGDQHFYYNYAVKTSELKFLSPSLDELFTNFSIPPLFNFLAAYFYMLFQNEFLLYLLPFVFYFLFILVMLSWFKENGLNVFLLAILIVISPIWLQYSVEFLREMPFIFLLTVFFYLMHRFDKAGENVFLFYSFVAIALALLTKIAGVYLFLFLAAYFVFVKRISLKLLFLPLIVLFAWFVSSPQSILFF